MKKSTLITTIAMIVVVVVALSTATYAWFSASSVSVATVSMTTTATSDWMIFEGTGSNGTYTFNNAAAETIDLTETNLQQGLYAPSSAEWANTIAIAGTQATVTSQEFLMAQKEGTASKVVTAPQAYAPYVLKVSNASGETKNLKVTVVINAGSTDISTGTLYAAAATTFDIAYITTKSGAASTQFTKGYTKCATYSGERESGKYAVTDTVTAATGAGGVVTRTASMDAGSTTAFDYSAATTMSQGTYSNFNKAVCLEGSDEVKWGLQANDYYLAYSITISALGASDSVYLSIYTWIDGWAADNSAGGADFDINFAFTSVA